MMLNDRYALITGGSRGLGKMMAKAFLEAGASVMICARDRKELEDAKSELSPFVKKDRSLLTEVADVAVGSDVDRLIDRALQNLPQLNVLVNNAGIIGPTGALETTDWNEWEYAFRTNLLGVVYTCRKLILHFKKQRYGKIINLSGGGATKPFPRISAYAASKTAVVRFTEALAEELRDYHIDVNSLAPGAMNTRVLEEVLRAGPEKVGKEFYEGALQQKKNGGTPLEKGASLAVFLASSKSDGITGKLISAVWDPWERLDRHLEDLREGDIYTLRRIVPKDRGKSWGERAS